MNTSMETSKQAVIIADTSGLISLFSPTDHNHKVAVEAAKRLSHDHKDILIPAAVLPPTLYFGIHLLEGETLTPMLLARRFTLNPVLVILSLVFWFWMWGVPRAILSTPMLAITKIICDRIRPLMAFGHFMEA